MILTKEQLLGMRSGLLSKIGSGWFATIGDLLDTIDALTRERDENIKQLKVDIVAMSHAEERILVLEAERDTAHAAAIAVAYKVARDYEEMDGKEFRETHGDVDISAAIARLTPAESQRSYDLRIAEARLDELTWATGATLTEKDNEIFQKRIAGLTAAVERLKGTPDAGEENAQAAPFAANTESGGA